MATSFKKKIFFLVFCLASITQGMYSTYFVSILTTIERIYQIQSKTAGAILAATEIGQILGSLFIAYYGGRGNKPKWISVCMTLSALAALISISPHFILLATDNGTKIDGQQLAALASHSPDPSSSSLSSSSSSSSPSSSSLSLLAFPAQAPPYQTSDLSVGDGSVGNASDHGAQETDQRVRNITLASPAAGSLAAHLGKIQQQRRQQQQQQRSLAMDQLCRVGDQTQAQAQSSDLALNTTRSLSVAGTDGLASGLSSTDSASHRQHKRRFSVALVISIFFLCLLAIGFGSTAITTLGIPLIDDIMSREESPFYLGLTIGLKIFGPALGFLLGSFCIRLNANFLTLDAHGQSSLGDHTEIGAWWLGLIIISLPLLVLAVPMYFLSRVITSSDNEQHDYEDITYQAAEDHDIGGSHEFPAHVLGIVGGDLDVTSSRTCYSSEMDSSSREVLQTMCRGEPPLGYSVGMCNTNYGQNIAFEQPLLTNGSMKARHSIGSADGGRGGSGLRADKITLDLAADDNDGSTMPNKGSATRWPATPSVCLVVNHLSDLDQTTCLANNGRDRKSGSSVVCAPTHAPISTRSSLAYTGSSSSLEMQGADNEDEGPTRSSEENKLKRRACHEQDQQQQQPQQKTQGEQSLIMGNLSGSLARLLKNRLLVLRMLSGVLHILPIAGFYTFLPKYLIEQFRISSSSASAISGLAGILFVGFGAFIGGTIIRLLNVNSRIMTRWIATSALLYALGMVVLMNLDCRQTQLVHFGSPEYVSTDCSRSCKCSPAAEYNPVCVNGTTFMSPCLAGCKSHTIIDGRAIFGQCRCARTISRASNESHAPQSLSSPSGDANPAALAFAETATAFQANLDTATQGQCASNCDNIFWYVILFSMFTLIHASCEVGSMMFNLRCVKSDDRTLALGLMTFSSSLLGTIPCSIIYGSVVDFTCVHWDTYLTLGLDKSHLASASADLAARGACRAYDNDSFRYYLHGLTALVMSVAFLIDCVICSRASEVNFYEGTDESKMDIRIGLKKSSETIQ